MRHIRDFHNRLNKLLSDDWKVKAQDARDEIAAMPNGDKPNKARSEAISKKSTVWSEAKDSLEKLMYGKCWYCEAKEVRHDRAVDHFRPKNEVKDHVTNEILDHPGYWWLAFEPDNFRYSCQYCNEIRKDIDGGGKSSYFPVPDETHRLKAPGDLAQENAMLLDPILLSDVRLLTFEKLGRAVPKYKENENKGNYDRAIISIKLYHLNHSRLVPLRQAISDAVEQKAEVAEKQFQRMALNDATAKDAFEDIIRELKAMISEDAEYSATAIATLRLKRGYDWVEDLLEY